MTATIVIGDTRLGAGYLPAFWPDVDLYFKRDIALAIDLVSKLADSGCRFLKAAALHDTSICLEGDFPVTYHDRASGTTVREPYADVISRHVLPLPELARITRHARRLDMVLVMSIYDFAGLDFSVGEGAAAIKIPSSNIVHRPLVEAAAASGLPLVIDTGRSSWAEIVRAVSWAKSAGAGDRLLIQHSPPGPPARPELFHMRMIEEMQRSFDCPAGLSDHHPGTEMFPIACALGCAVIEKGVVVDGTAGDIDIAHALPVSKAGQALETIRHSFLALGSTRRPDSEVAADPARMGLVAARPIRAGTPLDTSNIRFAFPRVGIGAEQWNEVVGSRARRDIGAGSPIEFDDVDQCDG